MVILHFFCQQFYALVLIKKLDLDQDTNGTNKTCTQVTKTNNQVTCDPTTFRKIFKH